MRSARNPRDSAGYFADVMSFPSRDSLRDELQRPPAIAAGLRFKYSNYGYALLGLVIESVTGEQCDHWIAREIIAPSGLRETTPDLSEPGAPFAHGHSARLPLGRRVVIPGRNATAAFSCVTGLTASAGPHT